MQAKPQQFRVLQERVQQIEKEVELEINQMARKHSTKSSTMNLVFPHSANLHTHESPQSKQ